MLDVDETAKKQAVYERKKEFVEEALFNCLKDMYQGIDTVKYAIIKNEEYVIITYFDGSKKTVLVTRNSPAAIVEDVIKAIKKR